MKLEVLPTAAGISLRPRDPLLMTAKARVDDPDGCALQPAALSR
jgi:hypothetical protein